MSQVPELVAKLRNELSEVFEPSGFEVEVREEGHLWFIDVVEYHEEYGDKTELYGLAMDKVLAKAYEYHRNLRGRSSE